MKPYSENCISSIKDELQKQNDNVDAFSNMKDQNVYMQSLLTANQRVTESLDKMMQFKILKESQQMQFQMMQMQFQMQMMQNQFTTQSNNEEEKKPKKTQKLIDQKI